MDNTQTTPQPTSNPPKASRPPMLGRAQIVMITAVIIAFFAGALLGATVISGMVSLHTQGTPKVSEMTNNNIDEVDDTAEVLPTEECLNRVTIEQTTGAEEATGSQIQSVCGEYPGVAIIIRGAVGEYVYGETEFYPFLDRITSGGEVTRIFYQANTPSCEDVDGLGVAILIPECVDEGTTRDTQD